MKALSIIFGVLMIIAGITSVFTPLRTFLSAGYFVGIIMFVYGLNGLIRAFKKESNVMDTIASILALIVGIVSLIKPGSTLMFDVLIVYFVAAFFLIRGVLAIVMGIKLKGTAPGWYWGLIVGILSVILGVFSFLNPYATAQLTGILIGLYFLEAGIDIVVAATAFKKPENTGD